MAMAIMLTSNAVVALHNGAVALRPVLQIVDIRQTVIAQTTIERFRLVLSDGVHLQHEILAPQLNEKVKNNLAMKGSIVQLLEYITNTVQNRKIVIVLKMEIMESKAEIIGDPKHLNAGGMQQAALPGSGNFQQPPRPALTSVPSPVSEATNSRCGSRSAGGLKPVPGVQKGATANGVAMEHGQEPNNPKQVCQPGMMSGSGVVYENVVNCQIINVSCVSCGEAASLISKLKNQG